VVNHHGALVGNVTSRSEVIGVDADGPRRHGALDKARLFPETYRPFTWPEVYGTPEVNARLSIHWHHEEIGPQHRQDPG